MKIIAAEKNDFCASPYRLIVEVSLEEAKVLMSTDGAARAKAGDTFDLLAAWRHYRAMVNAEASIGKAAADLGALATMLGRVAQDATTLLSPASRDDAAPGA